MFSRRTGWARAPNRLSAAVEARRRSGAPLLDLTETNPTRAGLRAPMNVLAALADPGALAYEPDPVGRLPRARPSPPTSGGAARTSLPIASC
jgi:hypothetical protein